jgi:hypothetical protein
MAEIITTPLLAKSEEIIRHANDQFGQQFASWVTVVGSELRAAQKELSAHKSGFETWCKKNFDWSKPRVYQILNASETVRLTSTMVDVVSPANERQCRELSAVPKEHVAEVWKQVVRSAEETETPITADRIKKHIEQQTEASNSTSDTISPTSDKPDLSNRRSDKSETGTAAEEADDDAEAPEVPFESTPIAPPREEWRIARSKTKKTTEALMRALDDLNDVRPISFRDQSLDDCRAIIGELNAMG